MAAGATDVVIRFLSDISAVQRDVAKMSGGFDTLKKGAKTLGIALGGAFAVRQVGDFVAAAEEAQSVQAGLTQALKNAGDATGQYAKHAADLANTLQYKTGIDDETIKKGQIILSTFHSVSDAAGQQSGTFDRATKAALDLSKAGFGSVESAATMLGKALEDPERGLTALRRAGVDFTPEQEKLIKSLVDTGDKAGAMNEILKTVEGQVGGVAEKSATAGDKMKVAWGETKEALGNALLPVLQQLMPYIQSLAEFVQQNATWLVPMTIGIVVLVGAIKGWIFAQTALNTLLEGFGIEAGIASGALLGIILAVALILAAIVLLYAKWDEVWAKVATMPWWAKILLLLFLIFSGVGEMIVVTAAFGVYWDNIWGFICNVASFAWNYVLKPIFEVMKGLFEDVASTAGWAFGLIKKSVEIGIVDPFLLAWLVLNRVIGWIIDRINDLRAPFQFFLDAAGKVGGALGLGDTGIGGRSTVGGLAAGGIVTRPTLAMIGERGPEAVIPLSRAGATTAGGGVTINVTTTGLGADAPAIQSAVVAALRQYTVRNGPLPATIVG